MIRYKDIFGLLFFLTTVCKAGPSLTSTVSNSFNQVFHAGGGAQSKVQGFVRLGGGFTILPDASSIFDTCISVSGPIDLRDTGTLILNSDLTLEASVTLSSGGKIDGQGNTLKLGGNITLPANKILHMYSNTTIDGCGHTLTVGDYAQLFVDNAMTLTLQNMVLKSGAKTAVFPPIRCAGSASKLALDNVVFEPGADIPFYQGSLSIYNSVLFTGTSSFIYSSPQASLITSGGVLMFDKMTTFSYAPATTSKDLIQMQDATARLILDGCTLKCTDTGLRLMAGQVLCDNKVNFDTMGGLYLSSLTTATMVNYGTTSDSIIRSVTWSPDGKYLAIGGLRPANGAGGFTDANELRIYQFNGTTLTPVTSQDYGSSVYSVAWSPDGKYIAIGGYNPTNGAGGFTDENEIRLYQFNGTTLTPVTSKDYGFEIYAVAWSPDGRYLAIGGYNPTNGAGDFNDTNELRIYHFNGTTLTPVTGQGYGSNIYSARWSPDGKHLAIGGYLPTSGAGGFNDTNELRIYQFNGTTLTPVTSQDYGYEISSVAWSPDGKYLAIGGLAPTNGAGGFNDSNELRIYQFNGTTLAPVTSQDYGVFIYSVAWRADQRFLVIGGEQPLAALNNSEVQIYAPILGANPNSQALSNSLVFGRSDFFIQQALYGNPPITDVATFANNLITKQGGKYSITARDEVLTGTMASFTYTPTNFSPVGQHTYFWNGGWPLLTGAGVGAADTLWTKFHALGLRDVDIAFANVADIDPVSNIIMNQNSYSILIGTDYNSSSQIWKGNPDYGADAESVLANPTVVSDGDDGLLTSGGGDYWASYRPATGEVTWGKGMTVGLDPKQTYTDASPLTGIDRVGLFSSSHMMFSNIAIGAGCDVSTYTYKISGQHGYFVNGGWVLPGGTNDVKWIKYYANGAGDADLCFANHANINSSTLYMSNNNAYLFLIRGWSNTQSEIAKGSIDGSHSALTGFSTVGGLPGYFWASVQQNGTSSVTLQWGLGTVVGQNVAQSYVDTSSPVLNLDRVTLFSGGTMAFSNIQVGSSTPVATTGVGASSYSTSSTTRYFAWYPGGAVDDMKWVTFTSDAGWESDVDFINSANVDGSNNPINNNYYEIYIGGWSNTKSEVHKAGSIIGSSLAGARTFPENYWACVIPGGAIMWGTGTTVGQNILQAVVDTGTPYVIDRIGFRSPGGTKTYTNIVCGSTSIASNGKELDLKFGSNVVQTLYQNQSLALSAAQVSSLTAQQNLNVKILSGAHVEVRGKVMDDSF